MQTKELCSMQLTISLALAVFLFTKTCIQKYGDDHCNEDKISEHFAQKNFLSYMQTFKINSWSKHTKVGCDTCNCYPAQIWHFNQKFSPFFFL